MKALVTVMLKEGVLDPQGKAIEHALHALDHKSCSHVRVGKMIQMDLDETDTDKARQLVEEMCEELLANTVIEDYQIELLS